MSNGIKTSNGKMIRLDLTDFTRTAKQHLKNDWPRGIVNGVSELAEIGAEAGRVATRIRFKLHSEYIPRGIRSIPQTSAQKSKAASALKKYGDFRAMVYVRPSTVAKNDLGFMSDHEYGAERVPAGKLIAIPIQGVKSKSYRTGSGAVRKRWKPATLLQHYNSKAARFDFKGGGNTTTASGPRGKQVGSIPGKAFIIRTKKGDPAIVRRVIPGGHKKKGLEFLYVLKKSEDIQRGWGFREAVEAGVIANTVETMRRHVQRLRSYS